MSKIISIGKAVPEFRYQQEEIADYLQSNFPHSKEIQRKISVLSKMSGISTRYSSLPDFSNPFEGELFSYNSDIYFAPPNVKNRLNVFQKNALPLALNAIRNAFDKLDSQKTHAEITHLITVSCTGLSAPGIDIEIIEALKLKTDTTRFSVNFMGCFAAFHALKIADMICKTDDKALVLIVCVELCSLHLQQNDKVDNLLSGTLFGDGSAAVLVASEKNYEPINSPALRMNGFYSDIESKGKSDMAWEISPEGFLMTLSQNVAGKIESGIEKFLQQALRKLNIKKESITNWAIHPGGKKIIEAVGTGLNLKKDDLSASYEVLKNYGNMSSPSVLFVLDEIWNKNYNSEQNIFACAFGPGLTLESGIFTFQ